MRACVIFNPSAKGQKAGKFRELLGNISAHCELRRTAAPGDARRLAARAVEEGFDTVFAAGGDGTLNEVLNGIADAPGGFEQVRLGVLPLGTINVFARELNIPLDPARAWEALRDAKETQVDVGYFETRFDAPARFHFLQLAGAGLDARAIELTSWSLKKKVGPLAYIIAGLRAMWQEKPHITVSGGGESASGQLVLIGNGSLYGGSYRLFPGSSLCDGRLDVCVFPKVNWAVLLKCGASLLMRGVVPENCVCRLRAGAFEMRCEGGVSFEVDGELAARLPARIGVLPCALRVLIPR